MTQTTVGDPARRDRLATLLRSYPRLSPPETDEVLAFLKDGAILDIGLLKGDPQVKAAIEQVHEDHPAHFKTSATQRLAVAAMLIVPLILMCWIALYWGSK